MATNRQYDQEYKIQAVKLAKEIGQAKAARELGIPKKQLYTRATGITVESVPQMMAFHPWSRDNNTIHLYREQLRVVNP